MREDSNILAIRLFFQTHAATDPKSDLAVLGKYIMSRKGNDFVETILYVDFPIDDYKQRPINNNDLTEYIMNNLHLIPYWFLKNG